MRRPKGKGWMGFVKAAAMAPLVFVFLPGVVWAQDQVTGQDAAQAVGQDVTQVQTAGGNAQNPPPPPPDAASTVRTVRLSDVEGKVQITQGDQTAFPQAETNMPLTEGMRVVTANDGRAEIQFEDGSVARVAPNSSLVLAHLGRNSDGSLATELDALTGLTYYELNGHGGQYAIRFGTETAIPSGNAVLRVGLDNNPAQVADMQGDVQFLNGQETLTTTHAGQSVSFNTEDPTQYEVTSNITADSWDQWNADRDQQLAALGQDETTVRAGAGNPDDQAWNDLDYYGDWYDVPGYGQAWSPAGVSADWDPFGQGSWGYYSGFGYTWISSYPWGWWPYHCGAWNYFNSYGWMWFPGSCGWGALGGGWYPYASVWRVPPGYKPPVRPGDPRHGPGPVPHPQPLIAVDRGPQYATAFRAFGGPKPAARAFNYNDQTIQPTMATVHPTETGPLGETFTSAVGRAHPEVMAGKPGTPAVMRSPYVPRGTAPGWHPGAAPGRPGYSGPAYHFSPPPAPHASAPATPHH